MNFVEIVPFALSFLKDPNPIPFAKRCAVSMESLMTTGKENVIEWLKR